jgi:DmsE family decaheme c-type cytochrome
MHLRGTGTLAGLAGSALVWAIALIAVGSLETRGVDARAPASPPGQAAAAPAQGAPAQTAPQAGYVGEDTCLTCHSGQDNVKSTAHGRTINPRTPYSQHGCESCHGPGQAHVDDENKGHMKKFGRMAAAEVSETCLTCHTRTKHALWEGSQHDNRNLGCTTCHSVHDPKSAQAQLRAKDEMSLCSTCHRATVNKQFRFNHMPIREGKMSCSSCHNVHGSTNVKLLKVGTTIDESCVSCHTEKRGPFLWEHAPVSDSCTTCHEPHGSNNNRMLVAKVPFLCQRCHVTSRHPPTVYEGYLLQNSQNANKMFGKGCVACHQQLHGSNSPAGKAFLR